MQGATAIPVITAGHAALPGLAASALTVNVIAKRVRLLILYGLAMVH